MKKELCKPCVLKLTAKGMSVIPVYGRSEKITCAECGRRKFGCMYDVTEHLTKSK